jgi:Holliday junction DNA helicase RuvB
MPRETILKNEQPGDELDRDLRPQRLADMVGQREVFERLAIAIHATQKRGDVLGHILFDGPPGLGKTTFAMCIPRELGVGIQFASGPGMKAPKDLVPHLTNIEERSVLFIDEIHRLPKPVEEYLYTAMEDFRLDIVLGEGVNARTVSISLKPFTLIGATTRAGMLSAPFRDRFHIREHLGFYSLEELTEILRKSAARLGVALAEEAAREIALRSRSTPRIANNRLRWVRDYAESKADGRITLPLAKAALEMAGVDVLGLDAQDRQYLDTLLRVFGGGPSGIEAIAHTMNGSIDTLTDEVEPFLLRSELIVRTPRGRMATPKAFEHMRISPPRAEANEDDQERRLF